MIPLGLQPERRQLEAPVLGADLRQRRRSGGVIENSFLAAVRRRPSWVPHGTARRAIYDRSCAARHGGQADERVTRLA